MWPQCLSFEKVLEKFYIFSSAFENVENRWKVLKFDKVALKHDQERISVRDCRGIFLVPVLRVIIGMRLKFHKKKPETVILVRFSKFKVLQTAGTEIYSFLVKYKNFENLEFQKNLMPEITRKIPIDHKNLYIYEITYAIAWSITKMRAYKTEIIIFSNIELLKYQSICYSIEICFVTHFNP